MIDWLRALLLTFVPLFIVIDAFGNLPFVIALSEDMSSRERRKMIHVAMLTAAVVGLAFLFFGKFILDVMGVSVGAFAIAGGLILLALSVRYVMTGRMVDAVKEEVVAVVPIGTPLTVGPATIAALLLLATQFSLPVVVVAFGLNLLVAWVIFLLGDWFARLLGQGGLKAISKVFSLLLAAIAVTMILHGLGLLGIVKLAA
ncbi:MAG: MarC family protein [Chloroflexota bacterium]|nr:MarC family protein [Chloroflexota bacterium]